MKKITLLLLFTCSVCNAQWQTLLIASRQQAGTPYSAPVAASYKQVNADSGEQNLGTGAVVITSTDWEIAYDSDLTNHNIVGIRFATAAIPQNSIINSAKVQFSVDGTKFNIGTNNPIVNVRVQKGSKPLKPTTTVNDISSRTYTTASSSWTVPRAGWSAAAQRGADQLTVDFSSSLQEAVNDPSYVQGHPIFVKFQGDGVETSHVWAENISGSEPDLVVTYQYPIIPPDYAPYPVDMILNGDFVDGTNWTLLNGSTIAGGIATIVNNGSLGSTGANWSLQQPNVFSETSVQNVRVKMRVRRTVGTGTLQMHQEFWAFGAADTLAAVTTNWQVFEFTGTTTQATVRDIITFGGLTVGDAWEIDWITMELLP